jgi:hypothetical protein
VESLDDDAKLAIAKELLSNGILKVFEVRKQLLELPQ